MPRRSRTGPPYLRADDGHDAAPDEDVLDEAPDESRGAGDDPSLAEEGPATRERPSLRGLSVAGFSRRRVAWLVAAMLTAWIVVVFARQVGDASAKATEANQARSANTQLSKNVAALQAELDLIQRPAFIEQQAHALGLGSAKDHAFALAADAPPLAADAPGSAAVRLGAVDMQPSPLDSWLELLFGPTPGG